MKKFENCGFTSVITKNKLKIEIPIKSLVYAFEYSPNNYDEMKIKKGKRQNFAEFCAKYIVEECDQETGNTYLTDAFDKMFDIIFEGYEDSSDFTVEVQNQDK